MRPLLFVNFFCFKAYLIDASLLWRSPSSSGSAFARQPRGQRFESHRRQSYLKPFFGGPANSREFQNIAEAYVEREIKEDWKWLRTERFTCMSLLNFVVVESGWKIIQSKSSIDGSHKKIDARIVPWLKWRLFVYFCYFWYRDSSITLWTNLFHCSESHSLI